MYALIVNVDETSNNNTINSKVLKKFNYIQNTFILSYYQNYESLLHQQLSEGTHLPSLISV